MDTWDDDSLRQEWLAWQKEVGSDDIFSSWLESKVKRLQEQNTELEAHNHRLLDVAREQQKTIEALEAFAEYIMRETDNIIEELGYKSLEAMNRETTRMDIRVFVSELQNAKKLIGEK